MDIKRLIRSGWVRRWHSDEDGMSDCGEENAEHQWTTCMIALRLNPELSRAGIIYALTHDVGELSVGDLGHDFKVANPAIATAYAATESANRYLILGDITPPVVTDGERKTIKLADQIAAYARVLRSKPHLRNLPKWVVWRDMLPDDALAVLREIEA